MTPASNHRDAEALAPASQTCYTSFPPLPMDEPKKSEEARRQREAQAAHKAALQALRYMEDAQRLQDAANRLAFGD